MLKLKQPATNSIKINGQKSFRKKQRGERSRDAGDVPLPSPSYQQYIMLWNCTKDCNWVVIEGLGQLARSVYFGEPDKKHLRYKTIHRVD